MSEMVMNQCENRRESVGVVSVTFGEHWLHIRFTDGSGYEYTSNSVGLLHMANLKRLARESDALVDYIARHCRSHFSRLL